MARNVATTHTLFSVTVNYKQTDHLLTGTATVSLLNAHNIKAYEEVLNYASFSYLHS